MDLTDLTPLAKVKIPSAFYVTSVDDSGGIWISEDVAQQNPLLSLSV